MNISGAYVRKVMGNSQFVVNVKRSLLNIDTKSQVYAIDLMRKILMNISDNEKNEFVNKLIRDDVIHLLCDSIAKTSSFVFNKLLKLMLLLAEVPSFYTNDEHVLVHTIASTMGTVSMLGDVVSCEGIIKISLDLISTILKSVGNNIQVRKHLYNLEQVLILVTRILESSLKWKFTSIAVDIICYMLEDVDDMKCLDKLLSICETLRRTLVKLVQSKKSQFDTKSKHACLIIKLCSSIITLISNLKIENVEPIQPFLNSAINVAIPYFKKNDNQITDSAYKTMLQFVLKLYTAELKCDIYNFTSKSFALSGFLDFVCSTYPRYREDNELLKLTFCVLTKILCSIFSVELKVDSKWPGGLDDFSLRISEGLKIAMKYKSDYWFSTNSPEIFKMWLQQTNAAYAIVFLCYIQFLSNPNNRWVQLYMRIITRFIKESSTLPDSPALFMKALWLTYAVSWLSVSREVICTQELTRDADMKLYSCLYKFSDLNDVYTHNSAILFWSFTVIKQKNLHCDVMVLWLSNCNSEVNLDTSSPVMTLCQSSEEARVILVDMIGKLGVKQKPKVMNAGCQLLHNLLSEEKLSQSFTNLPHIIWLAFSNVLTSYISESSPSDENLCCVIKLSLMCAPRIELWSNPLLKNIIEKIVSVIRVLGFTSAHENLHKKKSLLLSYCFSSLSTLLIYANPDRMDNVRNFELLYTNFGFHSAITNICKLIRKNTVTNDLQLKTLCLCDYLFRYQLKHSISSTSSIHIEWNSVIFAISGDNIDCYCRMVNFLCLYLDNVNGRRGGEHYVISFPNNLTVDDLRCIFMRLISNMMKGNDDIVYCSFIGMNALLNHSRHLLSGECYEGLLEHLLCQPAIIFILDSLYDLIRSNDRDKPVHREMFKFSITWLSVQKHHFTFIEDNFVDAKPLTNDKASRVVMKMVDSITRICESNVTANEDELRQLITTLKNMNTIETQMKEKLEGLISR